MKRILSILTPVMVLALAVPAFAGSGEKCEASTQECLNHMAEYYQNKGWIGIEGDWNEGHHLVINTVVEGGPAEATGFLAGDILFAVNGIEYGDKNMDAFKKIDMSPGVEVSFTLIRDEKEMKMVVTLGTMPEDVMAKAIGSHMLEHASLELAENE